MIANELNISQKKLLKAKWSVSVDFHGVETRGWILDIQPVAHRHKLFIWNKKIEYVVDPIKLFFSSFADFLLLSVNIVKSWCLRFCVTTDVYLFS